MDQAKVDAYPTAQVVFLAMKRFNEHMVDDHFKWIGLPYDQMMQHPEFKRRSEVRSSLSQEVGWVSVPTNQMLSAVDSIRGAQARVQQQMGLFQTIEAIRMYGAANAGKLSPSLGDLPYPAPNDPVSGKPFQYQVQGEQATLVGEALPFIQYRFRLRMAK